MNRRNVLLGFAALIFWPTSSQTLADVVVVLNRTNAPIRFVAETTLMNPQEFELESGQLVAIPMRSLMVLRCADTELPEYPCHANSACYFERDPDRKLHLRQIGLEADRQTAEGRELDIGENWNKVVKIPVVLCVDDDEPAVRARWEARLRSRIEAASQVFVDLCRVRFEVVEVRTWESTDEFSEPDSVLQEFERTVDLKTGQLAIGFSSQKIAVATEGCQEHVPIPLSSHLLIREATRGMTEMERVEVLVHQLGHFLGAVHTPEQGSTMRPELADGRARLIAFRIAFDPVNVLAMFLVAEEIRFRQTSDVARMLPETAMRLLQLYRVLSDAMPDDPVALRLVKLLESEYSLAPELPDLVDGNGQMQGKLLVASTRSVLLQIAAAARNNTPSRSSDAPTRSDDQLTDYYVQQAAEAARQLDDPAAARAAMLLALGIAYDDSGTLRSNPMLSGLCRNVETPDERAARQLVFGQPTLGGRADLAKHFFVSAFLTTMYGSQVAEAAGLAKEVIDARSVSGFSFVDFAADLAGIAFASRVLNRDDSLKVFAASFRAADFLPDIADLPEGLNWDELQKRFGPVSQKDFQRMRNAIWDRIRRLPVHQRPHPNRTTA